MEKIFCLIKKCNEMDRFKKNYYSFIAILIIRVFICTILYSALYADGSYSFMKVLENKSDMWLWCAPRNAAMGFTRIFLWIGILLGIESLKILAMLYSFGCTFWVDLFICIAIKICYKNNSKRTMYLSIIMWSIIITFTGFYSIHESLFAASVYWMLFIYFYYSHNKENIYIKFMIISLLILISGGTYESFGFFGILLLILFLVRFIKKELKFNLFNLFSICGIIVLTSYEIYYILNPFSNEAKEGLLRQLINIEDKTLLILIIFLCIYFLGSCFITISKKKNSLENVMKLFIGIFIFIFMTYNIDRIIYYTRMWRSLNIILPFLLSIFFIFDKIGIWNKKEEIGEFLVKPFTLGCFFVVYMSSYGYYSYLKNLESITLNNEGFIVWPIKGEIEVYTTDWTIPFESIFAQTFYNNLKPIDCIIVQDKNDIYFQPFNMWNIQEYYDLSAYKTFYNKEKFIKQEIEESLSANNPLDIPNITIELKLDSENYEITKDGEFKGLLELKNKSATINNINGTYPIQLGISLLNSNNEIIYLDYVHMGIEIDSLKKDMILQVQINLLNLENIIQEGGKLRFCLVQEGVGWFEQNAIVIPLSKE